MNIQIAGVTFAINFQESLILKNSNPFYKDFVQSDAYSAPSDIDITFDFDHLPDTKNLSRIFDGGQSWSMWQNSGHYFVTLHSPALEGRLVCAAEFDSSARNATVYPGDTCLERSTENAEVFNPFSYPLDQILLMYFLAQRKGALIHAAGIEVNGKGYIFPGKSGAGKTTLSRQFTCLNKHEIMSDDRIVVRRIDGQFRMFGTPWPGEAGIAQNKHLPLHGIFFISHGTENAIKKITPAEAVKRFMPVTSIPWYDKPTMLSILSFCEEVVSHIPAYEFSFRPEIEAVNLFEHFVSE
jgi:hypothetical protein